METTKLTTVDAVTDAINALVEARMHRSALGPVAWTTEARREAKRRDREECARFADLFEMRAVLWRELGVKARQLKRVEDVYASACAVAEKHDRAQVKHWRRLAGAR
jgi:hypothetical protein